MIVDTSALLAIVGEERGFEALVDALVDARGACISAANAFEAAIVVDGRRDPVLSRDLDPLRSDLGIAIAPFTASQFEIARQAYRDYGKGSGHPAKLNFGDCFAYALASESDEPLLFVGNDFSHTDIESALPAS